MVSGIDKIDESIRDSCVKISVFIPPPPFVSFLLTAGSPASLNPKGEIKEKPADFYH